MARDDGSAGEGAALDFSGHTYEELRTAILAADADAIRVGANEWADLRRRLNDRIGTLRLMIHKLEPDWDSGAGRTALSALRSHLDRMDALAKAARWNEDRFDALHETYHKAIKEFKELDASSGGQAEVVRNPGSDEPLPPDLADRRQPKAAQLAHDIYSQMALTSATLTIPEAPPGEDPDNPISDGQGSPGGGGAPGYAPGSRGGSASPGSTSAWGGPGVIAPPQSKASTPDRSWSRSGPPTSATGPAGGTTPGQAPAARSNPNTGAGGFGVAPGARSGPSVTGAGGFGSGGGQGVGRGVIGAPGSGAGSASAPPGGGGGGPKVIGGGPRPTVGTPGEPPPGASQPGHPGAMPGAHSGAGGPGRGRPGRRTNYEQGEPDTFRDTRHPAKPVLGQPSHPAKPVTAGPGVIGQRKQKPAETDRHEPWQQPQPAPSPEGLPDKLEDGTFTRRDGARFTVRRRGGGA